MQTGQQPLPPPRNLCNRGPGPESVLFAVHLRGIGCAFLLGLSHRQEIDVAAREHKVGNKVQPVFAHVAPQDGVRVLLAEAREFGGLDVKPTRSFRAFDAGREQSIGQSASSARCADGCAEGRQAGIC